MEQLQSHIWLTSSLYMGKYLRISSYIKKPFLIYDFATAPLWISLSMRKIWLSFLSVQRLRIYFLHCRYLEEMSSLQRRRKDFLYCSDNQDWEEIWDLSLQRLKIDFFIAMNEKRFSFAEIVKDLLIARTEKKFSLFHKLRRDLISTEIENRFLHCKEWEKISSCQRLWRDFFIAKIKKRFSLLQKLRRDLIIAESEKRFSLLCPKLWTQFSRKPSQNARFLWLNTTFWAYFHENAGL